MLVSSRIWHPLPSTPLRHVVRSIALRVAAQRLMAQRLMAQRLMAQRLMAQRLVAQRLIAQRLIAQRLLAAMVAIFLPIMGDLQRSASAQSPGGDSGPNWPRFRGPNGNGYVPAGTLPAQWDERSYRWTIDLGGSGHGSVAVWNDQVYVGVARSEPIAQWIALSIDLTTGQKRWEQPLPMEPYKIHALNSFVSSTPCCDAAGVCFAFSAPASGQLIAYAHDTGELQWQAPLGTLQAEHGFGQSPIIVDEMVVLHHSQSAEELAEDQAPGQSALVAFDRKSGIVRWRCPLATKRTCYGVPCVMEHERGTWIIGCETAEGIFAVDTQSGKIAWKSEPFPKRICSSPQLANGLLIASSGQGGGGSELVAIDPSDPQRILFRIDQRAPYVPSPVIVNEQLIWCTDDGIVVSASVVDGKEQWVKRIGGNHFASPLVIGDRILCLSSQGNATILSLDGNILGEVAIGQPIEASPAVAHGYLLIRAGSKLHCLDVRNAMP
jgi:outer membrane protein assembly factor BamB